LTLLQTSYIKHIIFDIETIISTIILIQTNRIPVVFGTISIKLAKVQKPYGTTPK